MQHFMISPLSLAIGIPLAYSPLGMLACKLLMFRCTCKKTYEYYNS